MSETQPSPEPIPEWPIVKCQLAADGSGELVLSFKTLSFGAMNLVHAKKAIVHEVCREAMLLKRPMRLDIQEEEGELLAAVWPDGCIDKIDETGSATHPEHLDGIDHLPTGPCRDCGIATPIFGQFCVHCGLNKPHLLLQITHAS